MIERERESLKFLFMNKLNLIGKFIEEGEMMDDNENKRVIFREELELFMEGKKSIFFKFFSYF